jgi:shikimate dehydrogenase
MTALPTISGRTRLFGIIADPIHHVRGPTLFNEMFMASGFDAVMVPLHIASADLPTVWRGLRELRNLDGFLVTVPHKSGAAELCDEVDDAASLIGAVNVVRREEDGRMIGAMFDGVGFVAGLRANGCEPAGLNVLLLGAGGAASAIALALITSGIAQLTIANRTASKAEMLAVQLRRAVPHAVIAIGGADPTGHDLVVNATSLGLYVGDPLPIDPALLNKTMTVADIIMNPVETPLLNAALEQGAAVQYGRQMLDHQMPLLARFLGLPASH